MRKSVVIVITRIHIADLDSGHQWEITLFCSTEANTIAHVDITPKSRASKVIPNDAKPAPTAYTMTYTSSKFEEPPYKFIAVITFKKKDDATQKCCCTIM
ncbi:14148_t:CDS:2 [Gigaspora rosea]|nr:14148_t:CDS:2 [Gigaspora rosea]